jgi:hypothetical protein
MTNYPTLTSNRATLGWGTLVVPAGIQVAARSARLPGPTAPYNLRMSWDKPFIFISCGQYSPQEKSLGLQIKAMIERLTPFEGYFAEAQSSLSGLVADILERLYHCSGFIAVMHPRGVVRDDKETITIRGSIWIEQEIAIAAMIQQLIRKNQDELPVAAYLHQSINREGIRTLLHLNPISFEKDELILEDLGRRLTKWTPSRTTALRSLRDNRVQEEIRGLSLEHVSALRILTLDGPTSDANALRQLQKRGLAQNYVSILPGFAHTSNLIQPVPGQVRDRLTHTYEMWEVKAEYKQALERYFAENPEK